MKVWSDLTQFILSMSTTVAPSTSCQPTVYFGYGSNLWREQMQQRCPTSHYVGVARLNNFQWIINERGYANVVEVNSTSTLAYEHEVWGLVYILQKKDESNLDRNEGVPWAYTKEILSCDYWSSGGTRANISKTAEKGEMLVYINRNATHVDLPKNEYIYRMNMGIKDAVKEGVPQAYVDQVMRKFIPEDSSEGVEALEFEEEK